MARTQESGKSKTIPLRTGGEEASSSKHSRWLSPFEEMSHMLDSLSSRNWMRPLHMEWPQWSHLPTPFAGKLPHVDVIDRENEIVLRAELPGVEKKDLELSMSDHTMTIKGSTSYEEKEEKGDYFRSEIAHGSFSRTVLLPTDVDLDNVHSSFTNGLLEVVVPKLEKAQRKISIN